MTTTDEIRDTLDGLERAGMIELASAGPEIEYLFRHVLIQEAAYDSLLRQERRDVHRLVAACLEEQYASRLDDLAPVLATHHERAGDTEQAGVYLERAGHFAMRRLAHREAYDAFTRAQRLLEDGRDDPDVRRQHASLALDAQEAGFSFIPADEGLEALGAICAEARGLGEEDLLGRALAQTAAVMVQRGELYSSAELRRTLDEALAIAHRRGDDVLRANLLGILGWAFDQGAEYRAAIGAWEEAIPILRAHDRFAFASMQGGNLATAHARLGDFTRALERVEQATQDGLASGNPDAILDADLARAFIEALRGNAETAIEFATRAAAQADKVDNKACGIVARSVIGEQRMALGQHDLAIDVLEQSASLAEFCRMLPSRIEFTRALLDSTRARSTGGPPPIERLDRVIELSRTLGDRNGEAEALRQRARDRHVGGQPIEEALADYLAAADLYRAQEARPSLAHTLAEHARALREVGREEEAAALVEEEQRLRREMGFGAAPLVAP